MQGALILTVLLFLSMSEGMSIPDVDENVAMARYIPDVDENVAMARYIVHVSETCHMSTISIVPGIEGYPFANPRTVSDGATLETSSGVLYFYTSPLDFTSADLEVDPRASVSFTLAESYCADMDWIAQDPRCPRLLITGEVEAVAGEEKEVARAALFERYPVMEYWPEDHGFFFAKLVPRSILLLATFGGAQDISIEEYFSATTPEKM